MCKGIVIDKPPGLTSHETVAKIKEILGIKKASHAGTLDPNVSGVMLVLLGEATKLTSLLQKFDKEYVGIMHLHKDTDKGEIEKVFERFTGEIEQTPPVRSAVARKSRKRHIYQMEVLEIKDRDVLFQVRCEAGTYIRKLCSDIGKELGGGHMTELRRTRSGSFSEKEAVELQALYSPKLEIPIEKIAKDIKKIHVKKTAVKNIKNGSPLYQEGVEKADKVKEKDKVLLFSGTKPIAIAVVLKTKPLKCKTDRILNCERE